MRTFYVAILDHECIAESIRRLAMIQRKTSGVPADVLSPCVGCFADGSYGVYGNLVQNWALASRGVSIAAGVRHSAAWPVLANLGRNWQFVPWGV